jgi:hypothetical protein
LRDILKEPGIILILMGIECDLLLVAARWVHEVVGVEVPSLSVVMPDADSTSKGDIHRDILHGFGVKSGLEFRAHEPVPVTRVHKTDEMDGKYTQVKGNGYDNQTKDTCSDMLGEDSLYRLANYSCW